MQMWSVSLSSLSLTFPLPVMLMGEFPAGNMSLNEYLNL
jgi:hypothetical protein